jgi:hypothetical protein
MSNNIYERGYIPTNIAGTIGNYGSSVQSMPNSTDMFNEWMQNNTSSALGNTGNVYPTPDQYEMFKKDGLNPITGEPLKPQSFSDMTGLQKLTAGMSMAGNLANIWSGIQQNRLAKDNFNFQKGVMNTNLANQISSYNTALEDRVAGRYSDREREANQSQINDYLDRNRAVNKMA